MNTKMTVLTLASVLAALLAVPAARACSVDDVCSDLAQSFTGVLTLDGVRLDWPTTMENGDVERYVLKRYNCAPGQCAPLIVASVYSRGACGVTAAYKFEDNPPDPDNQWTYRLEVWVSGAAVAACQHDVTPQ